MNTQTHATNTPDASYSISDALHTLAKGWGVARFAATVNCVANENGASLMVWGALQDTQTCV